MTTVYFKVSIKPKVTKDHLEFAKINELEFRRCILVSFCFIRTTCIKSFIFFTFCEFGLFIE